MTCTASPSRSVYSTITTASAPPGTGAPGMIRIASPAPTDRVGAWPAGTAPATTSRPGASGAAPAVSAARTAYPSIALLANGGTASRAMTSSAVTRPTASLSGSVDRASAATAPRISRWTSASGITPPSAQAAPAQDVEEHRRDVRSQVGAIERELEVRPQEVDLHAGVVPAVHEAPSQHGLLPEQHADGVGELELATGTGLDAVEGLEDARTEDVATDDGEVGGRVLRLRLLHHRPQPEHVAVDGTALRRTVRGDLVRLHLEQRDHRRLLAIVDLDHAAEQGGVVDHDVVAEHHRERLVPDVRARGRHRVPEAERLVLADEMHVGEIGQRLHLLQQVVLALLLQDGFQLRLAVEVVLHGPLPPPVCHEGVADAGADGLFDHVLDRRAVDDREHLLRDALARRQEARAQPGGGDHGLAHRGHHSETLPPGGSRPSPCSSPRTRRRRFGRWRAR